MKSSAKKRNSTATKDFETKMALAALKLAEKKTWNKITLNEIAIAAKVSKSVAQRHYSETNDLLPVIVRYVDTTLEKSLPPADRKSPPRDRLFEAIMNRLDILQNRRKGFLSILEACMNRPQTGLLLFRSLMTSMQHMLRLANFDDKAARAPVKKAALLLLYQVVIFRWKNDNSEDMGPTMAMLNSCLSLCEKIKPPHHKEPH